MPSRRRSHDRFEIGNPWLPSEHGAGARGIGNEYRWIAGSTGRVLRGHDALRHSLHGLQNLAHGLSTSRPNVQASAGTTREQMSERKHVDFRKIRHMDVV